MIFAEWLKFVLGRSHRDQERLKMIMTRVLLRFRWLDRVGQILYRGWHASYEQRRALERKLEFAIKDLDAARRSGYKVQLMLAHSQTQSRELQAEMIEDCESLQKRLAEAESSVEELTSELATRQRLSASCAVVAVQERSKEQEKVDALSRKYKALQVEEISLKYELGQRSLGFARR